MARARTITLPLLLLVACGLCMPHLLESFVAPRGVAAPHASAAVGSASRAPAVATQARGGAGQIGMDEGTYVIGISLLMIASVFANMSGFFNPGAVPGLV